MKKLILAAFALTTAASVFAQGTVIFGNRFSGGTGVGTSLHVWGPSSTTPGLSLIGLGSNDNPVGAVAFGAASSMTMIGASGSGGHFGYATTFAQLIGANGAGAQESSLVPQGQTTTFKSGGALGGITAINDTLTTIPADAAAASFEIVAWDNSSGLYPTWTQAFPAWQAGLIAAGHSAEFTMTAVGGGLNPIKDVNDDIGQNGITSFNLYSVPEPTSFALAGLGIAAMMIFRRRK
jgi:hypothetical protein